MNKPTSPSFASLVQEFFTDYMTRQRSLSPQTVASYRDSFLLLLRFAEKTLGKPATAFELSDLQPKFIASFLDHLERERGNSPRSRNIRLAALRSFKVSIKAASLDENCGLETSILRGSTK